MRRVLRTRAYRNQLISHRSLQASNRVLGIGGDSKGSGLETLSTADLIEKRNTFEDTSSSSSDDSSDDDNTIQDSDPLYDRMARKYAVEQNNAETTVAEEKLNIEAETAAAEAEAGRVAALGVLNAKYAGQVTNMVAKTTYVLKMANTDKQADYEAHLVHLSGIAAASHAEKEAAVADATRLAELNAEYADNVDNMVTKTLYVLKMANADKYSEFEAHLTHLSDMATAAEAEKVAAAEAAQMAIDQAEADRVAAVIALNSEYADNVSNMVAKTIYVLKGATNDKLVTYEAHLAHITELAAAAKAEAERLEAEHLAKEEAKRAAAEEAEKLAAEKAAEEARVAAELAKAEAERLEVERLEAEAAAKAERLAAEEAEAERLAAEKVEAERIAAEEARVEAEKAEKLAAEEVEAERIAQVEAARVAAEEEAARVAAEEAERAEAARLEAELMATAEKADAEAKFQRSQLQREVLHDQTQKTARKAIKRSGKLMKRFQL